MPNKKNIHIMTGKFYHGDIKYRSTNARQSRSIWLLATWIQDKHDTRIFGVFFWITGFNSGFYAFESKLLFLSISTTICYKLQAQQQRIRWRLYLWTGYKDLLTLEELDGWGVQSLMAEVEHLWHKTLWHTLMTH